MNRWRDYLVTLVLAILCALVVRNYLMTAYKVPTGSMQPSLKPGDFIFASRISYGVQIPFLSKNFLVTAPERGDIVVFSYPNQPHINYVKRVVGLPGDRVQLKKGRLFINEEPLKYVKLENQKGENPSPDLFDVYLEKASLEQSWKVIFQKTQQDKDFGPLVVPPGEVFLLGDNRDASDDSRYWGTVPMSQVVGKVALIWLSLDWQEKWGGDRYPSVRWERVFSSVH